MQPLTLDSKDGLGQVADVVAGNSGNRDATILGQVDRVLLGQLLNLLGLKASEGKHANLAGDVGPVVLGAERLELLAEGGTHGDNTIGHTLDLALPLRIQSGVVEDLRGDAGAVNGGVGVHRADDNLELRVDALNLLSVLADNGEGTGTLTVETLVLSVIRITYR